MADRADRLSDDDLDARRRVTPEVGNEGGSPGNVEAEREHHVGTGSEATETWRPVRPRTITIDREKEGRRNP